MEPITTVTGAWSIAKAAGEISKKLYELGKQLKDRETRQHVDEIVDNLRELKQRASELEDENRDLRARLRFKSDEYKFHTPFWYHKEKPEQPLCPKCFASGIPAPMTAIDSSGFQIPSRICLVCNKKVYLEGEEDSGPAFAIT
jgi:hypothetical protein